MNRAIIISADDLKKTIPGYNPAKSHEVHQQSAKLADELYAKTIKESDYSQVILMSGGGASGKTEFISEYLLNQRSIIVDGTLPSFEGAKIKAQLAKKLGKKVTVMAIWPEDLTIAYAAFLERDRKYPAEHFYRTHASSRKTLLQIAQSELDVEIKLYENAFINGGLIFYKYIFNSQADLIEELLDNQYTKRRIMQIVTGSSDD